MGFDRRFSLVSLGWIAALALAIAALVISWPYPGLGATRIVLAALTIGAAGGLIRHVERTNITVARFVEALRHGDYATRFDGRGSAGFASLGQALSTAMRDLQTQRARDREELRYWEALADDLPIALLTVDAAHGVQLANKAARRLFDRHQGSDPGAFAPYGAGLAERLAAEGPLGPEIVSLTLGRGTQRAMIRAATLARLGTKVRIVLIEPVQATLDAVEVGTQSDLVRVLTHEILNSLTPITSLAGTAAVLLGEEEPDLAEARLAVMTLARRAEGTRRFIDSYRSLARLPEPRRRRFAAAPFAAELARLFGVEWVEHRLTVDAAPDVLLDADPDLLAQLLINLLRNAAQASAGASGGGQVRLSITGDAAGAVIEVEDNGPGIPSGARADIFLPFYTTRPAGTGIGLNLARQIAVAHGWQIEARDSQLGGALLRVIALAGESRSAAR